MKAGDIVSLKGGGPKMTVRWVDGEDVFCEWFDSKGELKGASFVNTSLVQAG